MFRAATSSAFAVCASLQLFSRSGVSFERAAFSSLRFLLLILKHLEFVLDLKYDLFFKP